MQTVFNHPLFVPVLLTVIIIAVVPLVAGYLTLVERKVLADFQVRLGPMRVGPHGILQPIADSLKLMLKEDIIPTDSDKFIFWMAPVISTFTGLTAFTVLPFARNIYVADVSGRVEEWTRLTVDKYTTLREGSGKPVATRR